jgi:micrococcal nuclease
MRLGGVLAVLMFALLALAACGGSPTVAPTATSTLPATPTAALAAATPTVTSSAATPAASPTPTTAPPSPTAVPSPTPTAASAGTEATVVEVVDGDTIKVSVAGRTETIRIIGIDTPEVVDPREPVQCFGREASAKAKELLSGQQVRLVADPTQGERDKYNRLLRYVDLADGTDYGLWMIANGYAHEYTYNIPYQRQAQYKQAYREAREKSLGFWAPDTCAGDTTKPAGASATPTKQAAPAATPTMPTQQNCDPAYPDVCIAPPPPDLDCSDIPYRNFKVLPPDPHRFDSDKDGIGCEGR